LMYSTGKQDTLAQWSSKIERRVLCSLFNDEAEDVNQLRIAP